MYNRSLHIHLFMKKFFLALICLFLCQLSFAGHITTEEAQHKALLFVKSHRAASQRQGMRLAARGNAIAISQTDSLTSYYVFNIGEQNGFVVISGDDRVPAILGYADEGEFDVTNMPENMKAWFQSYDSQLHYLSTHNYAAVAQTKEHPSVRPLLKSLWNQGEPYYNYCPTYQNEHTVTGCVATAMAQVINYYKYPEKTTAKIPAYNTGTLNLSVSSIGITTIDWKNMKDEYVGKETTAEKNAVAKLMQLCGTSVLMDYNLGENGGSGANSNNVAVALKSYFDYDAATELIYRNDFKAAKWDSLIYNELANSRPVYYAGSTVKSGHAFVIDGYNKNGLYHVNWGWGGSNNGYFLLSILDPGSNSGIGASSSTDGYSISQEAIINAQPNTGVVPDKPKIMTIYSIQTEQTTVSKYNKKFTVNYTTETRNFTGDSVHFELGVGVFDKDNTLKYVERQWDVNLGDTWGYSAAKHTAAIPALPDGTYFITNVSREVGTDTWYRNHGADKYSIIAEVNGLKMRLTSPYIYLDGEIEVTGKLEKGRTLTVKATIDNYGTFFNEALYLRVNGENMGGRQFELEKDETGELEMTFKADKVGVNEIVIARRYWEWDADSKVWNEIFETIAEESITIAPAKAQNLKFSNGKVTNLTNGVVKDDKVKLQVSVRNNGQNEYDDFIRIWTLVPYTGNSWYYTSSTDAEINVPAGGYKTVNLEVPITKSNSYWFIIVYKNYGEFGEPNNTNSAYSDIYNITVEVPEVPDAIEKVVADSNSATAEADKKIYNLNGQQVQKTGKGIYIVGGKKIILK